MIKVIDKINSARVVPVIVLEKAEDALPLGEVLLNNGLPMAEITFRTSAAAESIRLIKKNLPELCIGAGTLLTIDSIQRAADAGADFFVSPGFNPTTAAYALQKDLLMIPGVSNPSLVEQAMEMGLKNLKFFPASAAGGTDMLKAFGSVYPDVSFMPTGGINADNIIDYLQLSNVNACGGSWMVKKDMIQTQQWDAIASLVKEIVTKVQNAER